MMMLVEVLFAAAEEAILALSALWTLMSVWIVSGSIHVHVCVCITSHIALIVKV